MKQSSASFYQQSSQIQNHYNKIAQTYNNSWEYSDNFVQFVAKKIIENLELKPCDNLVDIGCGTGIYTKKVFDLSGLKNTVICVDPSKEMIKKIPLQKEFKPLVMYARDFIKGEDSYNKVLMKHMLHVVEDKNKLLTSLYSKLPPKGILLLIMMPPTTQHPLFQAAIKKYERLQPHYQEIVSLFEKLEFKTTVKFIDYSVSIKKIKFLEMIKNYYLTLLSSFSEAEIRAGINELEFKYRNLTNLDFCERYVFIKGEKR